MEEDGAPSAFDLEAYIANYTGHAKLDRLLFIAEKNVGKQLELEALRLAHDDVKKTENTAAYVTIVEKIGGRLGQAYNMDRSWADAVDWRANARQERLEAELHGFKTNLIKESIRMGHNDLGEHFYERGDLQNAFKCYVRSRDYCTTSKHILSMCLSVIRVAVEMGNFMHVSNYVSKAESTPDMASDLVTSAKLTAASGLALLHSRRYKQAARKFVEVSSDLGTSYNDVLAPQDVALYGVLCALATFERADLHKRVIANIGLKEFLELVPEVRELVREFYNCRYAECLRALDALTPTLLLDRHLAEHVTPLILQIRQRALVQYTSPFTSVTLSAMAQAFNTSAGDLERELATLISDGHIQARIDRGAGVLYARHADARSATFTKVLASSEEYIRETKAALLRANLLKHDFVQKPRRAGGAGGEDDPRAPGGGGGGGGRRGDPRERESELLGEMMGEARVGGRRSGMGDAGRRAGMMRAGGGEPSW